MLERSATRLRKQCHDATIRNGPSGYFPYQPSPLVATMPGSGDYYCIFIAFSTLTSPHGFINASMRHKDDLSGWLIFEAHFSAIALALFLLPGIFT